MLLDIGLESYSAWSPLRCDRRQVHELRILYKSKKFLRLSLYSHIIRPFVKFQYSLIERPADIAISKESVGLSVHPLKHYSFILYFCLRVKVFYVKVYKNSYFEDPLMDFIHIWHDGRYTCSSKVFIVTLHPGGWPLGQGHWLPIFIKFQNFCV